MILAFGPRVMIMSGQTSDSFVGTWKLISVEDHGPDGGTVQPYGRDPVGILVYDATGHMSVQIMRHDRVALSAEIENAGSEEIKSAVEGFTAFFGTYEVDADRHIVTHNVEGHLAPNSVGKALTRSFEFLGDLLILRPNPTRTVTWKRIRQPESAGK